MAQIQYTLQDGRRLGVTVFGDAAAERIVVFCHPDPGSSVFDPDPIITNQKVRMVGVDRPGYGSTDPLAAGVWPSVDGAADELAGFLRSEEVAAEELNLPDFRSVGVIGWSGGGRVALALAARHPDLVQKVALVGTPAPHAEVPWLPKERSDALSRLSAKDPGAALAAMGHSLAAEGLGVVPEDEEEPIPLGHLGIVGVDAPALAAAGLEERLQVMLRSAYEQGTIGVAGDLISAAVRPWGFDLSQVNSDVLLVYGDADPAIGLAHGTWYKEHLPHATLESVPGIGRLAIQPAWKRIIDFVG